MVHTQFFSLLCQFILANADFVAACYKTHAHNPSQERVHSLRHLGILHPKDNWSVCVCTCVRACVCVCTWVRVCVYVCIWVFLCRLCVYVGVYMWRPEVTLRCHSSEHHLDGWDRVSHICLEFVDLAMLAGQWFQGSHPTQLWFPYSHLLTTQRSKVLGCKVGFLLHAPLPSVNSLLPTEKLFRNLVTCRWKALMN